MNTIAQAVQSQLQAIGVKVKPGPAADGDRELENYRDGKEQIGLLGLEPMDYPDAADYLNFPDRARWSASAPTGRPPRRRR